MKNQNQKIVSDYEMNEKVTNKIITMIENKEIKRWRKTWTCKPSNSINLYDYVIENELAISIYTQKILNPLYCDDMDDIKPGFYLTFADIKINHLKLKKGSKGIKTYKPSIFEKYLNKEQNLVFERLYNDTEQCETAEQKSCFDTLKENPTRPTTIYFYFGKDHNLFREKVYFNPKKQMFVYKKYAYVMMYYFNNNDLETPVDVRKLWGCEIVNDPDKEMNKIEIAENVKNSYIERSHLTFYEKAQDRAFYAPYTHSVTIPTFAQFENANEYYQTLFHEFAHSTGHKSLLNRATLVGNQGFGSKTYSKEELVAELSSTFTLNALGLLTDAIIENTIAYLASWGSNLKDSIRHNILNTISYSQSATNLILDIK